MTILKGQNKDLYIRQGDTGNIIFVGIPTDKDYDVYFSVYNPDTETIITEVLHTDFDQTEGVAVFLIDETFSNALPVGEWEYGLKICADGSEDTLLPFMYTDNNGELVQEPAPRFIVNPKYVEGD